LNKWFDEIKRVNPDVIYLYGITARKEKIVVSNKDKWIDDVVYEVRACFKEK